VEQRLRGRAASRLTTGQFALLGDRHSRMFEID